MKALCWMFVCLGTMSLAACRSHSPSAQRTLLGITGYGVSLELLSTSAVSPVETGESEVNVGKHASYAKRGSALQHGFVAAPTLADFSAGVVASPATPVTRVGTVPLPAGEWAILTVNALTGSLVQTGPTSGNPANAQTLLAATPYRIQIAWFTAAGRRASDWSPAVAVTTP